MLINSPSTQSGMYTRSDNKPITLRDLHTTLSKIKNPDWDRPVIMSSDEEGNEMLSLYGIEISKTGQVTLWLAHSYSQET